MSALDAWYKAERRAFGGPRLMLGGVLYGDTFMDIFAHYCLPTILSEANCAALRAQDATIALYTDKESRPRLGRIMDRAAIRGLRVMVLVMPSEVMAPSVGLFLRLSVAQSLLVQRAAGAGMAFHMLMPDQVYSQTYFPSLERLGVRNVFNPGPKVDYAAATPDLEAYRQPDGTLDIPSAALGDIGWRHTIMCAMNDGAIPDRLPADHCHLWRARDRMMFFSPYGNTAYMTPQTCAAMDQGATPTGTLDCHARRLFGAEFYAPTVDDDMVYIGLSDPRIPAVKDTRFVDRGTFLKQCVGHMAGDKANLAYYTRPVEMAASPTLNDAPEAEWVMSQQSAIADMMRAA